MKTKHMIRIFVLAVLGISCNSGHRFSTADDMVNHAIEEHGVKVVSVEEVMKIMEGEEIFNLIDVRQKSEHYYGYIPGSVAIPRGSLEFNIGDETFWDNEGLYLPQKDEIVIVYCKKGKRSILAAQSLMELGYTNVQYIDGGWKNWELTYPDMTEKNLEMLTGGDDSHGDTGGC